MNEVVANLSIVLEGSRLVSSVCSVARQQATPENDPARCSYRGLLVGGAGAATGAVELLSSGDVSGSRLLLTYRASGL
jgi:hypothetical protein